MTGTTVLSLSANNENNAGNKITAINPKDGVFTVSAKAVILAMGCRERSRGALNIPGSRPAGIFSAGAAQKFVNIKGYLPGKKVVILGSGDIGLIMARRMTLEGAKVQAVCEIMPYSSGLTRNIVQCLDDFGIPLYLSHTITKIEGKDRVTGVVVSAVDKDKKPIPGTEIHFDCDTVLFPWDLFPKMNCRKKRESNCRRVPKALWSIRRAKRRSTVSSPAETCFRFTTLWISFRKKRKSRGKPPRNTLKTAVARNDSFLPARGRKFPMFFRKNRFKQSGGRGDLFQSTLDGCKSRGYSEKRRTSYRRVQKTYCRSGRNAEG